MELLPDYVFLFPATNVEGEGEFNLGVFVCFCFWLGLEGGGDK